ncbi:MAG: response regulator [Desulfobacteraceae bacterium]|jgi:two-component system, cell cycle response regulator
MKTKILTVDDSRTIRSIIKKMLSGYQCDVIEAADGIEGLAKVQEEHPSLVILDIDMPGMNGLELLMNLRNDDRFMRTPVFMLTSKSKPENIRIAKELGIATFIAKPFKQELFLDRVQKVLSLRPL